MWSNANRYLPAGTHANAIHWAVHTPFEAGQVNCVARRRPECYSIAPECGAIVIRVAR